MNAATMPELMRRNISVCYRPDASGYKPLQSVV